MKKFLTEFKEFISRGNVIDLAVGVIIGGAFSAIVTSLTDNIIKPLINCIGGAEVQRQNSSCRRQLYRLRFVHFCRN